MRFLTTFCRLTLILWIPSPALAATGEDFAIQVVDGQTGRGVPLVELRTTNEASWWTDSNGIVAFNEPGLMDREVFFHVRSPGYEYPTDMFDNRGVTLHPTAGGTATVKIRRLNIAERLYRVTGQGIYRDSVRIGRPVPLRNPVLNGQVMGQDTVIATPYRGKIYWFWGDTNRPSYPLGNFSASGATSEWPGEGGLDPGLGVDLTYFVDASGFSKGMCELPGGTFHWIEGPFTVPDEAGRQRLVTRVANQANLGPAESWDLMVFDDEKAVFTPLKHWELLDPHQSAHPFRAHVGGVDYIYLFPNLRVKADWESMQDLANYEALTCVAGDGVLRGEETEVERDEAGLPVYRWVAGADRLERERIRQLVDAGKLKPGESWRDLHDFETGKRMPGGGGSVFWNDYRQRWIWLGESGTAGEIWFAEADTPAGPWAYARQVATHGDYNCYNPTQHPFFDQDGGRLVYFEGTYTTFFSGAKAPTPRYDYNQLMYRLDLADPRLCLPVAVYQARGPDDTRCLCLRTQIDAAKAWEQVEEVTCFALPPGSPGDDLVPVYATEKNGTKLTLSLPAADAEPFFLGLPLNELKPEPKLAGEWVFLVKTLEGDEFRFPLGLSLDGQVVRVDATDTELTGDGTFEDGKLILGLMDSDEIRYRLEGVLGEGSLTGKWWEVGSDREGEWSASWTDPTPPERLSPAVVILFEYRRSGSDERCYSTESVPPPGYESEGRPLCRVWKTPSPVLVMDPDAKPLPFRSE